MKDNSAIVLRSIWERFATEFEEHRGRRASMREASHELDVDKSALAKWMTADAPIKRRVPLRHLPTLRTYLMMSAKEYDQLMEARLAELEPGDETVIGCTWLLESLAPERDTAPIDQEEQAVLNAFREAREKRPRGLYFDADEPGLLKGLLEEALKRAQRLYEDEDSVDSEVTFHPAKIASVMEKLKPLAATIRKQRKAHFLAERDRIRRELKNSRLNPAGDN